MKAIVITIGEELLIGQVINTNTSWISEKLTLAGIKVVQQISINDEKDDIIDAIEISQKRADVIILTGGLGPTKDDITKKTLADYFHSPLIRNQIVYDHIKNFFAKRNVTMGTLNEQQADVPDVCDVLQNSMGTAPGMWFEKNGKVIISLPGVPHEMKNLIEQEVIPKLSTNIRQHIVHKTLVVSGVPESKMAEILNDFEAGLPASLSLAYLPSPGQLRLRLTAIGNDKSNVQSSLKKYFDQLEKTAHKYVVGYNQDTLASVIARLLTDQKMTLSTAESCTGGKIASLITEIPGSSSFFTGSIVAYSNNIKINQLDVPINILEKHGAVSKEVVSYMALGIKHKLKTEYSIAVSGIAGPTGGTEEKPVGLVWIAIANEQNKVYTKSFNFGDNRELNIHRASMAALNFLRLVILRKTEFP